MTGILFLSLLEVGMKNGCIDLGFEDQPDTVTFSEGYQDITQDRRAMNLDFGTII